MQALFCPYLEIETPEGDGNTQEHNRSCVSRLDWEIETPEGDGNIFLPYFAAHVPLEIETPEGDDKPEVVENECTVYC